MASIRHFLVFLCLMASLDIVGAAVCYVCSYSSVAMSDPGNCKTTNNTNTLTMSCGGSCSIITVTGQGTVTIARLCLPACSESTSTELRLQKNTTCCSEDFCNNKDLAWLSADLGPPAPPYQPLPGQQSPGGVPSTGTQQGYPLPPQGLPGQPTDQQPGQLQGQQLLNNAPTSGSVQGAPFGSLGSQLPSQCQNEFGQGPQNNNNGAKRSGQLANMALFAATLGVYLLGEL